ncbi:unnamed protein product [Parnassius apollo]|uniref:MOG interacting and ectopic P-granules protein 1 n=1 Tax=Parnassius apollo TaxID=110799 RepID=A0A8S3XA71_PARAO|nr:unnamed protein product [Parnassius apollo]
MELSHSASPKTTQIPTDENALDRHCEDSNSNEASNHIENDKGTLVENSTNCQANEDSNASNKVCNEEIPNTETKVPSEKHSNNIPELKHCSNSNESNVGSLDSSQIKSEHNGESGKLQSSFEESSELNEAANKEESNHEIDCDVDSSEGEGSEMSADRRAEDAVSINSDTHNVNTNEPSQDSKAKNSDMVLLENEHVQKKQNSNNRDTPSPQVHEIVSDNDDCVVENNVKAPVTENKVQLRRSSRAIKRKRYDDDLENGDGESDVELVAEDPLRRKSRPIVINDTKTLVQMAARQMKAGHTGHQKKEPTVVIIDTNSGGLSKPIPIKNSISSSSALSTQNLYQSIVARGTSVTPISSKTNSSTHSSSSMNSQPMILPSLTDDMYVVEAPSFIVPYVYEKPSMKPFREFVDELGSELEEQKAKEEKEHTEKDKEEKEKGDGEEEPEVETEKQVKNELLEEDEKKKKKAEKRAERRRRRNEDDDASWDGESSTDSDDEIGSDEEDKTIVIKDKADSIEEIKDVTGLTVEKVVTGKSDNYFDCSLGKFFMNIGLNLVQEFVQTDLLKQQNRKLYREKKSGQSTRATETSIASLMKNLEFSKENNAPYRYKQKKCEFCSFKSESVLVMAHHLETPHMKNNVYKCNYCTFEIRSPHDILYHMESEHNVRGKLERAPAYHQCANCPFEDNGKGKLARHLIPCAKKFKPEANLAPPVEWEPPAKIPKVTKSRNNNMMGTYQSAFHRGQVGNNLGRPPLASTVTGPTVGGSAAFRARGRSPMAVPPRSSVHGTSMLRGGVMIRHNAPTPVLMPTNYPAANNGKNAGKSMHQPSISITPLPRQPQPVQPQPSHQNKSSFVICEICDGYIKDLEQLRNHMQWIHKVKIHPKMIYNRPPLNCQKCQFRFFTDQGLERHLLGCHGLVTSSMQEAANKGKDAGRCPVCGRVYQWKLLNHVARDHNLTLKPAHLSYKCTVCTATFGMYKQFENHVYSAHSVVAKRVMDKGKVAPNKSNDSLLKPLKINDEITIIPQPAKPAAPVKDK